MPTSAAPGAFSSLAVARRTLVFVDPSSATPAGMGLCSAMAERRSSASVRRPSGFVVCSQTLGGADASRPSHDGLHRPPFVCEQVSWLVLRFPAGGDEEVRPSARGRDVPSLLRGSPEQTRWVAPCVREQPRRRHRRRRNRGYLREGAAALKAYVRPDVTRSGGARKARWDTAVAYALVRIAFGVRS